MNDKDIKILRLTPLRGPNIWTYRPVLEALVDIGELEEFPSNKIPGFYERLTAFLPSLIEHKCSPGVRGGFLQRVQEGTWPGHILEHVTIELQNLAGMQTGFGKARSTPRRGVYKVEVRSRDDEASRAAIGAARELVLAAIQDQPFDVAAAVAGLTDLVDSNCLGPSTAAIVNAATDRGIPHIRLTDGNLVQLGYGIRQRRIWTAETDRTSAIAESISSDKDLTKSLLSACGVPVPEGRIVASPAEAWDAAEDIGIPVVVKPSDGNHGRGVSLDLTRREQVEAAFHLADAEGSEVIVEKYIRGEEHRLLVIGGKLVAAARGEVAQIVADGKSTVAEMIESQLNTDPRRGLTEDFPLNKILLDKDAAVVLELEHQGLSGASVPEAGRTVLIQRNGNVANDVTDEVHPDVAELVALAARVVGLDIAGVDVVAEDISRPLAAQGGAIVEVNAGPGLLMHIKPAVGKPRPVGKAIVDNLFPASDSGRIPVVGVTGGDDSTTVTRLIAWLLHLTGRQTGLACADGLFLDRRQVETSDARNHAAAQRLLINRAVEAAVIENPARTILAEGLAYDRCQVGVVTGLPTAAGLEEFFIEDEDQIYNVIRTQVDVVLSNGTAVLNGDDKRVAEMVDLCDGNVILYAIDENHPPLLAHRQAGKRSAFIRNGQLVLAMGRDEKVALDLAPSAKSKRIHFAPTTLLAAISAAWALEISPDLIRAGIETFGQSPAGH